MKPITPLAALLLPLAVLAQPAPLLSITDPEGDDVGDGSLVYPRDQAFAPGDLDLRGLRVFAEDGGLRFEATFRNPIRHPSTVKSGGLGSEDLSLFARRGFYAFNIDIYIDTDRVRGSGNTATLPGRHARIAASDAWEKVVVLTPRPELMRRQLVDAMKEAAAPGQADPEAAIDASVFFATDVRVRGRTVSFFVPQKYLGSLDVAAWSLTAIVTAAKTTIEAGLSLGTPARSAIERLALGAQQPTAGRPESAMGYTGDKPPATAVVDLLAADAQQQALQLAAGGELIGLHRDNRYGAMAAPRIAAPSAAAPAATASVPGQPTDSWFSRALDALARAFGAGSAAPAVPAPAAPPPATAASAARPARDAAFFEEQELRLRALKRLRDGGLISEEEYQQKRREILDRL
ncbi:MAG: glucodextranase DOMON-like domain-containing protein [Burkholderiaceae bacterium]